MSNAPVPNGRAHESTPFHPYLVVRLIPGVYKNYPLPPDETLEQLIVRGWAMMDTFERRHKVCLVVGPRRALYLEPDGSATWSEDVPRGGVRA